MFVFKQFLSIFLLVYCRLEQEKRRQAEIEKQMIRQQEIEQEKEEQRKRAAEQRESARKYVLRISIHFQHL